MYFALIISAPVWVVILIACTIGFIITAMCIGPEKPQRGWYDFDLLTPALHVLNVLGWIITLILLLIFK